MRCALTPNVATCTVFGNPIFEIWEGSKPDHRISKVALRVHSHISISWTGRRLVRIKGRSLFTVSVAVKCNGFR